MAGLEETDFFWRYTIADPALFEKFRVKSVAAGVKVTFGKVKGTNRWEIQSYLLEKTAFGNPQAVCHWLDQHLKGEIKTLLDFKAWNEMRRRLLNAYMKISHVQ